MRAYLVAALVAFALTLGYAALLQPAWEPRLDDQQQYLALARGLVERGELTRAVAAEPFIPETYRLPGYPLFLAPLCLGGCDRWRIAVAQGVAFAALVLLSHALARRLLSPRRAAVAAILVALYLPFAYAAALAASDLAGALFSVAGVVCWVRALDTRSARWAAAAGALLGWAGLTRGALALLPAALAAFAVVRDLRAGRLALACVASALIVGTPYVVYSERSFARPSGGTSGLVLWLGTLQGRTEASLDDLERVQVTLARADIAAFDAMSDRVERARAWIALDDSLGTRARLLIAHDPAGWLARGALRSLELWGGDRPVPGGATGDVGALLAAVELSLVALGTIGLVRLARRGGTVAPIVVLVVLYVWVTALPFATEGRYALPARAFLMIGLAALPASVASRTSRAAARGSPPPRTT